MVTRLALVCAAFIVLLQPSILLAQSAEPAREFLDGSRTTFSTKDHSKAKGVNFTIAYPNSWAAAEGERPNIVQKFVSQGGRGLEMAMIITKELPLPPGTVLTNEDLKELFAPSGLRGMLPDGAVFVDARSTEIETTPAGILEYSMRADRAGMTLLIHAWTLNFLSGSTLVQVQFQVGWSTGVERDVARRMATFKPLFTLMANSIVLPDKWAGAAGTPASQRAGNMALDPELILALKKGHMRTCLPTILRQLKSTGLSVSQEKAELYCECLGNFYFNDLTKRAFEEMKENNAGLPSLIDRNRRAIQEYCVDVHFK